MTKKNKTLEKIVFIPDTHAPYQDKKAWELLMKVMRDFKPNHSIILGDFIDNYSISSHSKNPQRALRLEEEVKETKKLLDEVKALGAKSNVFVGGNHEDRLKRYLEKAAPELFDFISIPKVLDLDKKGFKYVEYKDSYKIGKLNITHDTGVAGRYAHYKALDAFQKNVVIGHTHRFGYIIEGNSAGERHCGMMPGWLGDVHQVDYMHKVKAMKDWSLGFGIGYLDTATGIVYLVPIPIINHGNQYNCLVEGKLYTV